jgi:hypothetical protein
VVVSVPFRSSREENISSSPAEKCPALHHIFITLNKYDNNESFLCFSYITAKILRHINITVEEKKKLQVSKLLLSDLHLCISVFSIVSTPLCVINLLKPTGYVMHQQCTNSRIVCSAHTVFMCFVFI